MGQFCFGVYPGGMSGTQTGLTTGPTDNPLKISESLDLLQYPESLFLVRAYVGYHSKANIGRTTPEKPEQYITNGRGLDLVVCFQSEDEDMKDWTAFIRTLIRHYSNTLFKIQITEEANVDLPSLDGHYKNSRRALVEGVIAAKDEIRRLKLPTAVGFNATPDFTPNKLFWKEISSLSSDEFKMAIDYVGIDFFPDVFRPLPHGDDDNNLKNAMHAVLQQFRTDMASIGLDDTIQLHITENGWPTSNSRTFAQQSKMLEKIIRQILEYCIEFNITCYELFSLRDASSSTDDIFYQFGLMRDDYARKPAFDVFKKIIAEYTRQT